MEQVKLIPDFSLHDLETEVNSWLTNNPAVKIIDMSLVRPSDPSAEDLEAGGAWVVMICYQTT